MSTSDAHERPAGPSVLDPKRWIIEAPFESRLEILNAERRLRPFLLVPDDQGRPRAHTLDAERTLIGRSSGSDVRLGDPQVSGTHALIERVGETHRLQDLDSTNGTTISGRRVRGERRLRDGDMIGLGSSWIIYRAPGAREKDTMKGDVFCPDLTLRQHDVVRALVAPLLDGGDEPATIKELAVALSVTEGTVSKEYLTRLYKIFGIEGRSSGEKKRRLAWKCLELGLG